MLLAAAAKAGARVTDLGIARDTGVGEKFVLWVEEGSFVERRVHRPLACASPGKKRESHGGRQAQLKRCPGRVFALSPPQGTCTDIKRSLPPQMEGHYKGRHDLYIALNSLTAC